MDRRSLLPPTRPSDYADSLRSSITDSATNVIGPQLADKPWTKEKQCWVCDTSRGMGHGKMRLFGCKFCLHAVCESCSPARLFHAVTQKAERMCSLCLESEKGEEAAHLAVEEKCKENNELRGEVKAGREKLASMREMRDMLIEDCRSLICRLAVGTSEETAEVGVDATASTVDAGVQKRELTANCETQIVISKHDATLQCCQETKEAALGTDIVCGKEEEAQTEKLVHVDAQTEAAKMLDNEAQCRYRENPEAECQSEGGLLVNEESQGDQVGMTEAESQWEKRIEPEIACQTDLTPGLNSSSQTDLKVLQEALSQTAPIPQADFSEQTTTPVQETGFQTAPIPGIGIESQTENPALGFSSTQTETVKSLEAELQTALYAVSDTSVQTETQLPGPEVGVQSVIISLCEMDTQTEKIQSEDKPGQTDIVTMEEIEMQCEERLESETTAQTEPWVGCEQLCQTEQNALADSEAQTEPSLEKSATQVQTETQPLNFTHSTINLHGITRTTASKESQHEYTFQHSECQFEAQPSHMTFDTTSESFIPPQLPQPALHTTTLEIGCITPAPLSEKATLSVVTPTLAIHQAPHPSVHLPSSTKSMIITEPTIKRKVQVTSPFTPCESGSISPKTALISELSRSTAESPFTFQERCVVKTESREVQTEVTTEDVAAAFADMEDLTARNEILEKEIEDYQNMLHSLKPVEPTQPAASFHSVTGLDALTPADHERISIQYAENQTIQSLLTRLKSAESKLHMNKPINSSSRTMKTSSHAMPAKSSCKCIVF